MEKKLNVLLYDPEKFASKEGHDKDHVYRFNRFYADDQALLESQLKYGLGELFENDPVPEGTPTHDEEVPNGYWVLDERRIIKSYFLDYYVKNGRLLNDAPSLDEFKAWFEKTVVAWMEANGLEVTVKYNLRGEYWIKVIGSLEVAD